MTYQEELSQKLNLKLNEILNTLPTFCDSFISGIEDDTSIRTRVAYAQDLTLFFNWLKDNVIEVKIVQDLELITADNIRQYMRYLNGYEKSDKNGNLKFEKNTSNGKARKLAAIKSVYRFFFEDDQIEKNPSAKVKMPKIKEKPIVRLEGEEIEQMINVTKTDDSQMSVRDTAIITLLLGTGMRVSECVGINLNDIKLEEKSVMVTRKGGNRVVLYYNDEVKEAIQNYLNERMDMEVDTDALFVSKKKNRLSVREIQRLVEKYGSKVTDKKMSPHKLRKTYGCQLYKLTNDIFLVADALDHKDINTTKKHYVSLDEDRKKFAGLNFKIGSK